MLTPFARAVSLSIIALGLWTSPCTAQTNANNTIDLCGAALHMGMTKTETFDAVGKQCAVTELNLPAGFSVEGGGQSWCVSGKFACSNTVIFDLKNSLHSVSKDLGSAESADAANLLADFISAVDALTSGTGGIATIKTNTAMFKTPDTKRDMVTKGLTVAVGDKTIELQVNRVVGGGNAATNVVGLTVKETLSAHAR